MLSLIKADLFRIYKSKLARISLILAASVPILIVLMYYGINQIARLSGGEDIGFDIFNARTLIASSFSLSDNVGIIVPVFSSIFCAMDFSSGIARNKIIAGHTRNRIYLSHLITSIIFNVIMIIIYASVTAGLSFIFFDYGVEFTGAEVKNLLFTIIIGIGAFVFVATISSLFAAITQSVAPTIIFTILVTLVLTFFGAIFVFIDYSDFKHLIYLVPLFANTQTQLMPSIENALFIETLISYLVFGGINVTLALIVFNKKDMK